MNFQCKKLQYRVLYLWGGVSCRKENTRHLTDLRGMGRQKWNGYTAHPSKATALCGTVSKWTLNSCTNSKHDIIHGIKCIISILTVLNEKKQITLGLQLLWKILNHSHDLLTLQMRFFSLGATPSSESHSHTCFLDASFKFVWSSASHSGIKKTLQHPLTSQVNKLGSNLSNRDALY